MSMCMRSNQKVRPKGICSDTLANEGMELDEDQEEIPEEIGKEGRVIPGKKMIYEPTKAEFDEHSRTHCPFRAWCPCRVKGRSVSGTHKRIQKTMSDRERELPTMRWDYMGPKSKGDKSRTK